jgi:hypothetical protein
MTLPRPAMLSWTVYKDDGWAWREESIATPDWNDVEFAIRRMNRFQYPIIRISAKDREMGIIGGNGAYFLRMPYTQTQLRTYWNQAQGDEEVWVWESDQGMNPPACSVCFDIDIVLRAAKYFLETGEHDPSISWKPE